MTNNMLNDNKCVLLPLPIVNICNIPVVNVNYYNHFRIFYTKALLK